MLPCFGAFFYVAARCFSRCLIFWCFWIKPKARKKESKRIFFRSILRETILPLRLCVSCKEWIYHLLSPKGGAKSVRQAKSSGNGRRMHLKRYADKLAPAFSTAHPPPVLLPDFSQCGDSYALHATKIIHSIDRRAAVRSRPVRRAAPRLCGSESIFRRRLRPQRPARRCPPRTPTGRCAMVDPYVGIPEGFLFGMINPNF